MKEKPEARETEFVVLVWHDGGWSRRERPVVAGTRREAQQAVLKEVGQGTPISLVPARSWLPVVDQPIVREPVHEVGEFDEFAEA